MAIENLYNTGIKKIGDEKAFAAEQKTLIVVGPARGGTSMVAGTLDNLGVFTGQGSNAPVFEDVRLANAAENGTVADVRRVVEDYNAQHDVWAYKRPGIINNFGKIHDTVRNPVYLFIFKDIFSMANRNSISMHLDVVNGLNVALEGYQKITGFIKRRQPTGLLLSYDRVMQNKEAFVDVLTQLIAPATVTDEQRAAALAFIDPNPEAYLNASRVTRGVGHIASLSASELSGAGHYVAAPGRDVEVEVRVNGEVVGRTKADGHQFAYTFESPLSTDDVVSVRLTDDVVDFATETFSN
ncbi:hypothetical protein [Brevibacterium samyangense]|uniref:Sulfotransferase family protein n=1 Tax=Brevibacterium samyangense TaxID=366888 RepID=A0ABP5F365_9MICO